MITLQLEATGFQSLDKGGPHNPSGMGTLNTRADCGIALSRIRIIMPRSAENGLKVSSRNLLFVALSIICPELKDAQEQHAGSKAIEKILTKKR